MTTLPRRTRLQTRQEFLQALRRGRRITGTFFRCHYVRHANGARLGIVVARPVGSAVVRNRLKRLIRETFRHCRAALLPGDRVCVVLPGAARVASSLLRQELTRLLQSVK